MVAEKIYIAPDEYLRQEREASVKSEYVSGEIIPMAGESTPGPSTPGKSTNHNRIKDNFNGEFYIHLRGKGCRSYSSDQRVNVPTNSLYAYPDVVVVCGPNQFHDEVPDTLVNPTLIVEALSPGTAAFDRGEKFALYRQSPALQEYVLADSEKTRVDVFRKHEQGYWFLASEASEPIHTIQLASVGLTIALADIYAETDGIIR